MVFLSSSLPLSLALAQWFFYFFVIHLFHRIQIESVWFSVFVLCDRPIEYHHKWFADASACIGESVSSSRARTQSITCVHTIELANREMGRNKREKIENWKLISDAKNSNSFRPQRWCSSSHMSLFVVAHTQFNFIIFVEFIWNRRVAIDKVESQPKIDTDETRNDETTNGTTEKL